MNQQILQLSSVLDLLEIGISANVFLFDEDVWNRALTRLFGKVGLDFISVIYQMLAIFIFRKGDVPI
jgi:hypothetical protein